MADILKGLGGVLAGNIKKDLLTTTDEVCLLAHAASFGPLRCGETRKWKLGGRRYASSMRAAAARYNLRMLVYKFRHVVDLVVDDDVEILLGVVLSNILVSKLLGGHLDCVCR